MLTTSSDTLVCTSSGFFFFLSGIDANIKDSLGRTVLDILKEHPSQKSLQIATLLQGKQY